MTGSRRPTAMRAAIFETMERAQQAVRCANEVCEGSRRLVDDVLAAREQRELTRRGGR